MVAGRANSRSRRIPRTGIVPACRLRRSAFMPLRGMSRRGIAFGDGAGARSFQRERATGIPQHRPRGRAGAHPWLVRLALADGNDASGDARPPRRGDTAAVVRPRHPAHASRAARVILLGGSVGTRTCLRPGRCRPPPDRRVIRQARADLQRRHRRGPPRALVSAGFIHVPPEQGDSRNLRRPAATAHGHTLLRSLKPGKSSRT